MSGTANPTAEPGASPPPRASSHRLSKDGKWRAFPKVPHLLQYVSSGTFYGRTKVHGKIIRQSLDTNVFTTARLRLADFLSSKRAAAPGVAAPLFEAAVQLYRTALQRNASMKQSSRDYRELCINKVKSTWPGLWRLPLSAITPDACSEWAAQLKCGIASQLLQPMAHLTRMEPGKLGVIRHKPRDPNSNLQCRQHGKTVTRC